MQTITLFIDNFILLTLDASPWLLLGLLIAGLMKFWLPNKVLSKHLGQGKKAIIKAAFIGAPLPLCSCGVIPVATQLNRSGASKEATAAFLVATPETGVDSISVSYAMLGPIFAIYRPIAAISSAIFTGFLVATERSTKKVKSEHSTNSEEPASCCSKKEELIKEAKSCCAKTQPEQSLSPIKKYLLAFNMRQRV